MDHSSSSSSPPPLLLLLSSSPPPPPLLLLSSSSHPSYSHESYYARNGHLSPTLVARLSNNIHIPSPRQSIFPRPVASVFDPVTSFARRIWAVFRLLFSGCGMLELVLLFLSVVGLVGFALFVVVVVSASRYASQSISEVEYIDCSAVGRGEDCTVVRVPAREYVLDPIVLYEPREHQ
ncbi:hypothetical protein F5X68DRAFT_234278 [Plectosphaerella plurivora]|uniref:Transmembrane protein n=1 Tax=Plectosphaerella plurivora TaxID=936078 RepID=A0A9P9A9G9_9PEZI|nr:hypothetical protein F5X68DRAFT_234278 [Plectosphaerella plurivora]